MKIIYTMGLILVLLMSACAQQQQVTTPQPEPEISEPAPQAVAEPEPEVAETAEEVVEEEVVEKGTAAAGGDVRILGKNGFEPDEIAVSAGSAVAWINDDKKVLTMAFFKDGKFYQNSDKVNPGEIFEMTFEEKGNYEYWVVAYGVKAKIIVE